MQDFTIVLVTSKTGEDPFKNEGASVATAFLQRENVSSVKVKLLQSECTLQSKIKPIILWLSSLPARMKKEGARVTTNFPS